MSDHGAGLPDDEKLYDDAACGLLLTSKDGRILRANATFCRWCGYSAAELQSRCLQDLLTMGGKLFHQTRWVPMMELQGALAEVSLDMVHHDGRVLPLLVNAVRRQYGNDVFHEIALMMVRERHQYERELLRAQRHTELALKTRMEALRALENSRDQLAEADRRKDEFLATLAHELRNPLAPMCHALEVLRQSPLSEGQRSGLHELIERQVRHLVHLVDDLLDVSRITQGKLELRREPVLLEAVIQSVVEAARPQVSQAGHQLQVVLPARAVVLNADPVRLTQIILNLLNNAVKYTPAGGLISVTASAGDNEVEIAVQDNGIGIQPSQLAGIFDMFAQLTPALHRAEGGLGVGLALVRGLVERHGGSIHASSAGPGHGCSFVVRLPVEPGLSLPEAKIAKQVVGGKALRIAVVDDNEDAAASLAMLLALHGHEVRIAHDGQAGLQLAAEFSPHVLVLDIGLPGLNGYELARRIRRLPRGEAMQLLALSGWGQEQDKRLAGEAGFDHHLTKPVEIETLLRLLPA